MPLDTVPFENPQNLFVGHGFTFLGWVVINYLAYWVVINYLAYKKYIIIVACCSNSQILICIIDAETVQGGYFCLYC